VNVGKKIVIDVGTFEINDDHVTDYTEREGIWSGHHAHTLYDTTESRT
jgi:hypothetical protein